LYFTNAVDCGHSVQKGNVTMAKVNPTELSWAAPTTNVDGSPIQYELNYELGIQDADGVIQPNVVVVGTLRQDEKYVAPIADMGFETGLHVIALRSMAADNPQRVSEWSGTVDFYISDEVPKAPLEVAVS
jgi:hypothetical protein